ncbi:MAG: transcriptional regulator [Hyphomicrobium sp.]|nr:transcriptional regulator [Rhodospirillum sp.]PPD29355.1 MAG: transcriptional regulator [Hyphomicrobium sp.]
MNKLLSQEIVAALESDGEVSPELKSLVQKARKASEFLKALAHENRLLILCLLSERERSVTELENLLSLSQPTVSQQLARLRLDGLVETRRDGRTVYYQLADEATRKFIEAVYNKFCRDC